MYVHPSSEGTEQLFPVEHLWEPGENVLDYYMVLVKWHPLWCILLPFLCPAKFSKTHTNETYLFANKNTKKVSLTNTKFQLTDDWIEKWIYNQISHYLRPSICKNKQFYNGARHIKLWLMICLIQYVCLIRIKNIEFS